MAIEYLFIGDDFTGASDTLAAIADKGKKARLFLRPLTSEDVSRQQFDAIGFASELRAVSPEVIKEEIGRFAPAIHALKPNFIHYKVCSTFDSSPSTGNIATAVHELKQLSGAKVVAIVGGQPSLRRYCCSGNLFAADISGEVHRIDRHPVMSVHPSTPMKEADLRLHLAEQGLTDISLVLWSELENAKTLSGRLDGLCSNGATILFDALSAEHIVEIGSQLRRLVQRHGPVIVVGASSVPEAILSNEIAQKSQASRQKTQTDGPCLVIGGSRSSSTASQIDAAALYVKAPITPETLTSKNALAEFSTECAALLAQGENVIAHLQPDQDYGMSGIALAQQMAKLANAILDRHPVRKLGIAGGDTSSIIVRHLGFKSLDVLVRMSPGVGLCLGQSDQIERNEMELMLKGGQVGGRGIFDAFAQIS